MMQPYYDDGQIQIWHGDALDVLPSLASVDLVLTDPPYGITYQSNRTVGRGKNPITNDGTRLSLALYRQIIPALQASHVLWFTRWDAWPDVWAILGMHFPLRGVLVWDKGTPGMGDLSHWGLSYELIASAGEGKIHGGRDSSVLRFPTVAPNSRHHPTEKPVALFQYLIDKLQPDTVLDPFMGSGTSLLAARHTGRRAIGIETSERYCEIAATRLQQAVLPLGAD
jgi:site-specific DNA-methyltransferase (adenine-specific)